MIDRTLQSGKYSKYLRRSQKALKSGNFMVKEGPKELKGESFLKRVWMNGSNLEKNDEKYRHGILRNFCYLWMKLPA